MIRARNLTIARLVSTFGATVVLLALAPSLARAAGSEAISTCGAGVFHAYTQSGIAAPYNCPYNPTGPGGTPVQGMTLVNQHVNVPAGHLGHWQVNAPSGFLITGASVARNEMYSIHLNDGHHWGGGFYWQGGGAKTFDTTRSYAVSGLRAGFFGTTIFCSNPPKGYCGPWYDNPPQLTVEQITLVATETSGPWLAAPTGLWAYGGWVRGQWPLSFWGNSPSGLCSIGATFGGKPLQGTVSARNGSTWHQCAAPPVADGITTAGYGQGATPLTLYATDATGLPASYTKMVLIDNTQPTVAMSGPRDAPSTAGTQYVTASAGGSLSGIAGLSCSVDRAAAGWYPGSVARVAVAGIGQHSVVCSAANNAVDTAGNHGWSSTPGVWHLGIRMPTAVSAGLTHVSQVRCHKVAVWQGRGKHRHRTRVLRCRHVRGSLKQVETVAFGHRAVIVGRLRRADRRAVGRQVVRIVGAPLDGSNRFTTQAITRTQTNGTWRATLPAGPSRIIVAVYGGNGVYEPAASGRLELTVPAHLVIHVRPTHVRWATQLVIAGRLFGGYIPSDLREASQLLKIRIGVVGIPGVHGSVGVPGLRPDGRFSTTFCLAPGRGVVRYWFSAVTLYETNYPYAKNSQSNRAVVRVGPGNAPRRCS